MADLRPPPLGLARLVRWSVSLHCTALVLQVIAALTFISGNPDAFELHRANGWIVLALGVLQGLAILAFARQGMGAYFTAFAAFIPIGEFLLIQLGQNVQTAWHVTLAMLVWSFSIALVIRVANPAWAPKAQAAA